MDAQTALGCLVILGLVVAAGVVCAVVGCCNLRRIERTQDYYHAAQRRLNELMLGRIEKLENPRDNARSSPFADSRRSFE